MLLFHILSIASIFGYFYLVAIFTMCLVLDVVVLQIEELKAEVSNKEYQIITECAVSNFSEVPQIPPPLNQDSSMTLNDTTGDIVAEVTNGVDSGTTNGEVSVLLKLCVSINLVELSLYTGLTRDASLATVQVHCLFYHHIFQLQLRMFLLFFFSFPLVESYL